MRFQIRVTKLKVDSMALYRLRVAGGAMALLLNGGGMGQYKCHSGLVR